jgi:hypothetical protein
MRRRQRIRRKIQAFFVSVSVACGVIFVFDDGPLPNKPFVPLMQANGTMKDLWQQTSQAIQPIADVANPALPTGFRPTWEKRLLDHGRIHLTLLKQPYAIGQTEHGLGREYFAYAASLFNQMAGQVHSPALAEQLKILSAQAAGIGNTMREAGQLSYDGPPTPSMAHLKTRENLLTLVQSFSPGNMITVAYNGKGQKLGQAQSSTGRQAGESLKSFLENSRAILVNPGARQYPETLQLVQYQSQWLERVATNVTLRWDSTRYCSEHCTGFATRVRVYAQQQLPQQEKPNMLASTF